MVGQTDKQREGHQVLVEQVEGLLTQTWEGRERVPHGGPDRREELVKKKGGANIPGTIFSTLLGLRPHATMNSLLTLRQVSACVGFNLLLCKVGITSMLTSQVVSEKMEPRG